MEKNYTNRQCPLLDGKNIDIDDCYENCLIAEQYLKSPYYPKDINKKENASEICLACEYHDLT
jgi:hypothetical protein